MIRGIGIDAVDIRRIEKLVDARFLKRILTPNEIEDVETITLPDQRMARIAKLYAAKEAIAKAYGTGIGADHGFQTIEISRGDNGQPLARALENGGNTKIHISLSDEYPYAFAYAIVEE